jgi:hypothetical protein
MHAHSVRWLTLVVASLVLVLPAPARAAAPEPELMRKLAVHAAQFEQMKKRASYAIDGRLERLDGDGNADEVKQMQARVEADGTKVEFKIVRYLEDGEDKTEDAKKKQREREAEKAKDKDKKDFHMPFFASEQARYTFDQVETDKADAGRVRITFVPKERTDDTIEGSAWVDTNAGTVISAGFKMSKTPTFVDFVHITVEFGEATALGPAVSKVHLDGRGGFLFFRKRFRADATMRGYRITP